MTNKPLAGHNYNKLFDNERPSWGGKPRFLLGVKVDLVRQLLMTIIFFGDLASVNRHSMVYHIMLNKLAYGMQLNNFPQNPTGMSKTKGHSTISSKFTFSSFLLSTRLLILLLHSCSQMLCKYFFFFFFI